MSMSQLSSLVMENFDEEDELALPAPEKPSSSPSKPKLKRLKKAAVTSLPQALGIPRVPDAPTMPIPESSAIRTGSSNATENKGFGEETGPAPELDPLFVYRSGEEMMGDPCVQEVKVKEGGGGNDEEVVVVKESEKEKNVKRKLNLEDEEEDPNMKKKKGKSRKLKDPNGKPKESVRERKRLDKERKAELERLHAESQRLLRETSNASFKPVQLMQKPISSVLKKIRLRKLEILKSSNILGSLPFVEVADCTAGSDCKAGPVNGQIDIKETDRNECVMANVQNNMKDLDVGSEGTQKNPTNDTQEDKGGFQLSTGVDNLLNPQKDIPSYPLNTCLNVDGGGKDGGDASSSDYDVSTSEEESDKENISPSIHNVLNKDSSPKDGIAKAFLDDEAEEEDDSDCDLLRFQENEDEDETDEHEELDDLIATGYEEAPIDQEKRNELHQKWLEQQDAAETDNVLQRIKSGREGLGKPALIHGGDYDNYDRSDNDVDEGNDDNDGGDEALYKNHPIDTSHQSLKKAKQMISHMFTDANDVYLPSDDEETEKNLIRHHILKHHEEPSLISPVEDESSREFFGLIKKLNIAPSTKKRAKASAPLFDSLILSGSSNSSKSSFLNRTNSLLSTSYKQRSISVKAFIFGRDDSNSKSNISTSEIPSETAEKEGISAKNSRKDRLSSQVKSSVAKGTVQAGSETGSSLFNILRRSSIQYDKEVERKQSLSSRVVIESEAAHKFSAFKLRRNSKMDSRT
ncbi:uncharacterized protein LOC110023405 isoform X2 [Phalaenopsis equestris]|uniref:uncharacterized protein LOC110023405 isoform X2 n=1 Tax=Phalaenopsis equestris TaxID=78828 RepID=UPI0009E4A5E6|nr:uncharacterized protein LOC110023405 isoform X2 [Phalaenopsis equestris]